MTAGQAFAAPGRSPGRWALLLVPTLTVVSGTIAPALPGIREHFAAVPGADLLSRMVLSTVGLALALAAPVGGVLSDRIGRRPVLLVSLALFAAGGLTGLFARTLPELLAGRVLVGAAMGGILTAGGAMVVDLFAPEERARFMARQSAAASLAGVAFMPLAGVLAQEGWRLPFLIHLWALAVLALGLGLPVARAVHAAGPRVPLPRAGLAAVYAAALVYMLVFYLLPTQLPFRLRAQGVDPRRIGLVLALAPLASAAAAAAWTRIAARVAPAAAAAAGLGAMGAGWLVVASLDSPWTAAAGAALTGAGSGIAFPSLSAWLGLLAPPAARGRAMAGLAVSICLGQFASPLAMQPLVARWGTSAAFVAAGAVALALGAGLAAARRAAAGRAAAGRRADG